MSVDFKKEAEEYYNSCKKAGYKELTTDEMREKECYRCSHFRGGVFGGGCWCSEEKCDFKERKKNEN